MLSFKGGIKPLEHKYTKEKETVCLPSPEKVRIFTYSDEICVSCNDVVSIGDKLTLNHKAHSSISGVVTDTSDNYVTIENDSSNRRSETLHPFHKKLSEAEFNDILSFTEKKGICFNGVPFSQKLLKNKDKAGILIVSCGETAPFLCSSYRILREKKKEIFYGAKIIMKALNINKAAITLESKNKRDIREFNELIGESKSFEIITHSNKYPFDEPEVVKRAFEKRYSSAGKSGVFVVRGYEAAAIYESFKTGMPMVNKIITVDGDSVLSPVNLSVPIGTPVANVISFCNIRLRDSSTLINGNPLSAKAISSEDVITKETNALIALSSKFTSHHISECISCGKCHAVCPMCLYPDRLREAEQRATACIGCGCCSYICPSRLDFSNIYAVEGENDE